MKFTAAAFLLLAFPAALSARDLQPRPADAYFEKYEGWKTPVPEGAYIKEGDRLAICGDSITEQKMYSRIMETYLTVCVPDLKITCRQFGWSGEQASGFVKRLKNDVLRFQPTVATTCYGMNDHRYVPYTEEIGAEYVKNQQESLRLFKEAGVRVVLGSPGTIGLMPTWVKSASGTQQDLNLSLLRLRNLGIEMAERNGVRFADVYWPMLTAGFTAQQKYGKDYMICGKDGVHPGWAGQAVMAYAFLKGLGLDGEIGTLTWDAAAGTATASGGHGIAGASPTELKVKSTRYPFCAPEGDPAKDDNIRSAMALIPFNESLNRFTLVLKNASAENYAVTWGTATRTYSKAALEKGVNLAADFAENPFSAPFENVSKAVFAKQDYETRQIKQLFHGPEGAADMEATAALTEKTRARLVEALRKSVVPVEHTLVLKPA
ncbi:MAG: SGNH/GDSL hydrolase family protein [Verrucomicrobiota bacterium]